MLNDVFCMARESSVGFGHEREIQRVEQLIHGELRRAQSFGIFVRSPDDL